MIRPAAALACLLSLACTREQAPDVSQSSPSQSSVTTVSPRADSGTNTAVMDPTVPVAKDLPSQQIPAQASAARVRVELQEYAIRMPQTLRTGRQTFEVVNSGKESHSLGIEGNGIDIHLPATLTRGDSATLEVDLKPGLYTVYCPVDGHKGKGMSLQVTVQ